MLKKKLGIPCPLRKRIEVLQIGIIARDLVALAQGGPPTQGEEKTLIRNMK